MKLIDERTADGSRCFARLPRMGGWATFCRHAGLLADIEWAPPIDGDLPQGRIAFCLGGQQFQAACHNGTIRLIVCDPLCPDVLLYQVARHFQDGTGPMRR